MCNVTVSTKSNFSPKLKPRGDLGAVQQYGPLLNKAKINFFIRITCCISSIRKTNLTGSQSTNAPVKLIRTINEF